MHVIRSKIDLGDTKHLVSVGQLTPRQGLKRWTGSARQFEAEGTEAEAAPFRPPRPRTATSHGRDARDRTEAEDSVGPMPLSMHVAVVRRGAVSARGT